MNLSKRTIDILKNYATINQSIVVAEGKRLSTVAIARNVLAECDVEETFPQEFAIYNLNEFLSAVSLFDKPDLDFQEKFVMIREEGGSKRSGIKYFYSNKVLIVHPQKAIKMPDEIDVIFDLTEATLTKVSRAAGVLNVGDLVVVGDSEGISLVVQDRKNDSSNDFEVQVSDKASDEFKFYFKQENLKMIPGDYSVQISSKGIALFKKADGTMQYAVALEAA